MAKKIAIKSFGINKKAPKLDSGLTPLNLSVSGNPDWCIQGGECLHIVGESDTAKTVLCMQFLAEACNNSIFDDYHILIIDSEEGNRLPIEKMFGSKLHNRLNYLQTTKAKKETAITKIEEVEFEVKELLDSGEKFILVIDSLTCLDSVEAESKFDKKQAEYRSKGTIAGDYRMQKPKAIKACLSKIVGLLNTTDSILICTSQGTEKIKESMFEAKRMNSSGGNARKFMSHVEVHLWARGKIKEKINGKDREIGTKVRADIIKNRVTGFHNTIYYNVFPNLGIDDISSTVDYLLGEEYWEEKTVSVDKINKTTKKKTTKKLKAVITKNLVRRKLSRKELILNIQNNGLYNKLREEANTCYSEIMEKLDITKSNGRKSKYS